MNEIIFSMCSNTMIIKLMTAQTAKIGGTLDGKNVHGSEKEYPISPSDAVKQSKLGETIDENN